MLFGLVALTVLLVAWRAERVGPSTEPSPACQQPRRRDFLLCGALLMLGNVTALVMMPPFVRQVFAQGDAYTHAHVIAELARSGFSTGWLDSYQGGFPLGHHYPPLGWLAGASLVWLGLDATRAMALVGGGCWLTTQLLVFGFAARAGARLVNSGIGAFALGIVSPYNGFVGGLDTFWVTGLFAQSVGVCLSVWMAGVVITSRTAASALLVAPLAMAGHSQVCVSALGVLGLVALTSGNSRTRRNALGATLGALIAGAALYGQGIFTLNPPFGWPALKQWARIGFGTRHLSAWLLDGELLDLHRAPWLSSLTFGALLISSLFWRNRLARTGLAAFVLTLTVACIGPLLDSGPFTRVLLEFAQPLRALAVVPVMVSVLIVIALELSAPPLRSIFLGGRAHSRIHATLSRWAAPSFAFIWLVPCLVNTWQRFEPIRAVLARISDGSSCAEKTPEDFDAVMQKLPGLSGGRLWVKPTDRTLHRCAESVPYEIASGVPIAATNAVGAHVGVLWAAYHSFEPQADDAWLQAKALGIGYVLLEKPLLSPHYRRLAGGRDLYLYALEPASSVLEVGCVSEEWSGPQALVGKEVMSGLSSKHSAHLLNPDKLVRLAFTAAPFKKTPIRNECNTSGARVRLMRQTPGHILGQIEAPTKPVVVVAHVSAFPSWKVTLDGKPSPWFQVAPGFVAVSVSPGKHLVEFRGGTLPYYPALLGGAAALLLGLAWFEHRWRPRSTSP